MYVDKNKSSESLEEALEEARDLPFRVLWGRALEKLYHTAPVRVEIQEVKRKDNECGFTVLDEERIGLEEDLFLSIGIARGELLGERGWKDKETIYPQKEVTTETGEEICVMHTYLRVGRKQPYHRFIFPPPVPIKRLKMVGRWRCWSKDEEGEDIKDVNEYMHPHQVDIFLRREGEQYLVVVRNWGFEGHTIDVYDEQCRKTTSIPSRGEIVIGKGVVYLQLPGAYILEGPNNSIAKRNVFLKIVVF